MRATDRARDRAAARGSRTQRRSASSISPAPERALGERAARQLVEQVQAAQPGTRFIELGDRDTLLASVGSRQFDPRTLKKIGEKHGLAAVFIGELAYTEPMVDEAHRSHEAGRRRARRDER